MTKKARVKRCLTCGNEFVEKYGDSNSQWEARQYCSRSCNSSSNSRVTSIFERLERYQVKGDGCWGWSGTSDMKGYGILSSRNGFGNSPEKAHRVSYEKHFGEIPLGMYVCHRCDNPECTNPGHLFLGTQKDNMIDCSKKGRLNKKSLKNLKGNEKWLEE